MAFSFLTSDPNSRNSWPKSSAIAAWPKQGGGIFNPPPSSYHTLPAQCRVPAANPAPSRALLAVPTLSQQRGGCYMRCRRAQTRGTATSFSKNSAIPAGTKSKRGFQGRADFLEERSGSQRAAQAERVNGRAELGMCRQHVTAGGAGRSDESLLCFSSFHFLLLPVRPGTACGRQPGVTRGDAEEFGADVGHRTHRRAAAQPGPGRCLGPETPLRAHFVKLFHFLCFFSFFSFWFAFSLC